MVSGRTHTESQTWSVGSESRSTSHEYQCTQHLGSIAHQFTEHGWQILGFRQTMRLVLPGQHDEFILFSFASLRIGKLGGCNLLEIVGLQRILVLLHN